MSEDYKNLGALTTPNEYIDYYYNQLKDHYAARNLQISKNGFIGFMLNVLGFSQYDIKYYFDTLFREAFLATADNDDNLKLHASIYGYSTKTISPSSLVGSLTFFIDNLPLSSTLVDSIVIKNLKLVIGGIPFNMDSVYRITNGVCEITKSDGQIIHVPYDSTTGKLSLIGFNQYEIEELEFTLPYYVYGTHYQKIIQLGILDSSIYDISCKVKEQDSETYTNYSISTVKYYSGSNDEVIFNRELINNQLIFEFGSGINGKYIPESVVSFVLKYTRGFSGNILNNKTSPISGDIFIFNESNDQIYSGNVSNLITVDIDYAVGGVDNLGQEDLRDAIIDYIQSRNNLISETDFYNILSKHLTDFILLFKKINIVDNTIYAFVPFKDKYLLPIKSTSFSIQNIIFNPRNKPIVYKPEFSIGGFDYISPFIYQYDSFTRNFNGGIYLETYSVYFSEIKNILNTGLTLPLSLLFTYSPSNRKTRIVVQSYQQISDYVIFIDIPVLGVYSCMEVFDDNNQEYYYINDLYDGLIPQIIDVSIHIFSNTVKQFTYLAKDVKLMHDISDILTLGLYEFLPEYGETGGTGAGGTGQIGSDPNNPGVGWVFTGGGVPSTLVGVGAGWFLPQTGFVGITGGVGDSAGWSPNLPYIYTSSYIMNIPVMLINEYIDNVNYYDQKFINTLGQISIDENRMISDDFQIRFLNSIVVEPNILKSITVQNHTFRLQLPLNLNIDIAVDQDLLIKNSINLNDFKIELLTNLATHLVDRYTGVNVSFYKTQIVDIIHNNVWVKHCDVRIYDSSPIPNEIPLANFELVDQSKLSVTMSKFDMATFCPVYIWWNLDTIDIQLTFE